PAPGACLGAEVVAEVTRAVDALHRLGPPPGQDALARFREEFTRRYEGREVPLVEALDEESGIGFQVSGAPTAEASPLLAGLGFPAAPEEEPRWRTRHALLLGRLGEALASGARELALTEDDLRAMATAT